MIKLVKNEKKYWEFIRCLRTHKDVKKGFIQQADISQAVHKAYMEKYGDTYYIALVDGQPAGFMGVINNDIRVATDPAHQGHGIAKFMVTEVMKLHPQAFAKVKVDNDASLRLFESCGFKKKFYILEQECAKQS